jgi:hypothetical protein
LGHHPVSSGQIPHNPLRFECEFQKIGGLKPSFREYSLGMDSKLLKDEFEYYLDHQADYVAKYAGKFIVLKNHDVLGVYDTNIEAYHESEKHHAVGSFLIQFVQEGEGSYTQTFHSRVLI